MKKIIILLILTALTGCTLQPAKEPKNSFQEAYLQIASAGLVGCEPKSIGVSGIVDIRMANSPRSWRATCKNTAFICSQILSEESDQSQVSCSIEL